MNIGLRVFHGPNIHTPFAAVAAEFEPDFSSRLAPSTIESNWRLVDDTPLWNNDKPSHDLGFAELALRIAVKLQHPGDPEHARVMVKTARKTRKISLYLGFIDHQASLHVLRSAITLAERIFLAATGNASPLAQLAPLLKQLKRELSQALPQSPIIRTLVREAHARSIPVSPVAKYSRIWLFGQGAAGRQYFEAANERDSFTGMKLQRDKTLSNSLVKRLGFPGVSHAVAMNIQEALSIAGSIGYPVVVKPISSGKGNGVSAFVVDAEDLQQAFTKARSVSADGIIVEAHVKGNDHRLAVFGGKLAWVAARYPASVVGDGVSTIGELIAIENRRRTDDPGAADGGLLQITADQDMIRHLQKQGLTLDSRAAQGSRINLRSIANISKGGAIADVTELAHPDNIEMAEAIARSFRMDTMGIDFLTPDIGRSWREVPCAVIEVNGTPGIFFDHRAARILDASFKAGSNGRIPSLILISPAAEYAELICQLLSDRKLCVGHTSHTSTQLNGQARCQPTDALHARISALVADPGCTALVIETRAEFILENGLPLDWADLVCASEPMPEESISLLRRHTSRLLEARPARSELEAILDEIVQSYAGKPVST